MHVWSQNKHNHKPNCTSSLESSCIPVRTVVLHHSVTQMLQAKSIKQWFAIDVRCANLALTKPCPKKCVPKLKQSWVDIHPELTIFFVCAIELLLFLDLAVLKTPNDSCLLGLESEVKMIFRDWILDDFGYYASVYHSKRKVWRDSFLFYTGLNVQSILAGIEIILSKHVCPLLHVMIL